MQGQIGRYYLAAWIDTERPCGGKAFCFHVEGEPGLEGYELMLSLTRTRSLFMSLTKLGPEAKGKRGRG